MAWSYNTKASDFLIFTNDGVENRSDFGHVLLSTLPRQFSFRLVVAKIGLSVLRKTQLLTELPVAETGRSPGSNSLPGGNRALAPPDPIPNSAVKRCIADGSAGVPV